MSWFYEMKAIVVGFQVPTEVVTKSSIFWDITPCSPLNVNRYFGGTGRFHLQGQIISQAKNCHEVGNCSCWLQLIYSLWVLCTQLIEHNRNLITHNRMQSAKIQQRRIAERSSVYRSVHVVLLSGHPVETISCLHTRKKQRLKKADYSLKTQ
jgi:hypothetical protein